MPLLQASTFIGTVLSRRVVTIEGPVGSGKTLLAFAIYRQLVEMGAVKYLVSNVPSVWNDPLESIPLGHLTPENPRVNACIILDESAQVFTKISPKEFFASIGKLNIIVLLPSAQLIDDKHRQLMVMPYYNYRRMGIPAVSYIWRTREGWGMNRKARDGEKDFKFFKLWKPHYYYGVYSTNQYTTDDRGIGNWLDAVRQRVYVGAWQPSRWNN